MNYPSDQPPYYSYDQYHQGYQQRHYQTLGGQPNGHLSNMRPQGGSSGIYPHNETMDNHTTGSQGPQKLSNGTNTLSIYNTPAGSNRRGFWSPEEDRRLMELISIFGASNWVKISNSLSTRTPKQCRERYHQNLKPSLNRKPISTEEGELIEQLVAKHGKKWAEIARHLNGRSDNAVKNWWNGGANRKRRATVHMKASPEQLFSTTAGHPQDLIQDQRNVQPLPQPLPQPHPPQQISFKTSMFGNQEVANNTPPLSSTSSANSTSPYRTSNQRLASLDVDNVSQLMHHHNMHGSSSQSANTNVSNLNSNQNIVLPPLNNVNGSLPSLILPSKKRLLDEHNPISRRHSYANTMYSVQNQNAHANNITNSNPNLSNLVNASHQPNSLNTSGQSSPYHGSPLMLSNQASRNNSISIPNFEFSTLNSSNATSLSDSRRSSYNPDFFPNPLKDNPQTSHKRNISQNSFNSPLTPSYRYSVSSGGSAYNTTTNTNSNSNSNANTNINTGNTTINSAIDADQPNASPKKVKADKSTATGSEDKRRAGQDKNHFGSDRIDGDQDMKENTEATENTKISVSSLLD